MSSRRCTYCLQVKPASAFTMVGDHVIPASLGGAWIDRDTCDTCNTTANAGGDEVVAKDPLIGLLRDAYGIPNRRGDPPPTAGFSVRVRDVGVLQVELDTEGDGHRITPRMAPADLARLGLDSEDRARELLAELLHVDVDATGEALVLARAAQEHARHPTPPPGWARFTAKLALACGRYGWGDTYLDTEHAERLSRTLLDQSDPVALARAHHPPVDEVWPFTPPKHRIWIEDRPDAAMLVAVLFGQVIDAVPINEPGTAKSAEWSAWTLDPLEGTCHPSSYPAVASGTAAAILTKQGRDVVMLPGGALFIADGELGPVKLPIPTFSADSPLHALQLLSEARGEV